MTNEELDRTLLQTPKVIPSDGFVNATMRRLQAPPPIAFPWKSAWPGLAAWVIVLAWFLASLLLPTGAASDASGTFAMIYATIVTAAETIEAGWLSFALLLSLFSVVVSLRLTGKKASVAEVWGRL